MVLKASPFSPVLSMFRDIEKPTAYHWALVLQSASDNRDLEATDALFHEMRSLSEQSTEAVKPTVYTWSILLHAYLRTHDAKRSQAVYDDMLASGIIPSSVTYSMIIRSYAGGGQSSTLERAEAFAMSIHRMINDPNTSSKILEEHGSRGQVHENLFSPLVVAAGQAGNPNLAGEYFDRVAEKETPSIPLFTQYLDAWRKAGDLHMVRSIWAELFALACRTVATGPTIPDRRSSPTRTPDNALCIPLSIVLITYGKEKRLLDIKETWESVRKAGFGFDVGNFNHLAVSLAQSGDVEGAFDVVENVLLESDEAVGVIPRRESTPNATDPASRPPNRRAEQQSANYDTLQRELDPFMLGLTMNAKSDTIWRPHFHTIATLDSLVSQLEDSRTGGPYRAWMGALAEEGEEDGDLEGDGAGEGSVVMLNEFGTYVKDPNNGQPKKTSSKGILTRLNRKYSKAMALVMFHRRKQAGLVNRNRRTGDTSRRTNPIRTSEVD
jgi:pentatricopeptide repeat protein